METTTVVISAEPGFQLIDLDHPTDMPYPIIAWRVSVTLDDLDGTDSTYVEPVCINECASNDLFVVDDKGRVFELGGSHRFRRIEEALDWWKTQKKSV